MEPPSHHVIGVLNESGRRAPTSLIRRAIGVALDRHNVRQATVDVLLADEPAMQALNLRFRNLDEPTDVLTFPGDSSPHSPLGDVAICIPYAERQAKARGVSLRQEVGFLAIHGALHLLGFDDETDGDRARMVDEMNILAIEAGLKPDPEWASILHAMESSAS